MEGFLSDPSRLATTKRYINELDAAISAGSIAAEAAASLSKVLAIFKRTFLCCEDPNNQWCHNASPSAPPSAATNPRANAAHPRPGPVLHRSIDHAQNRAAVPLVHRAPRTSRSRPRPAHTSSLARSLAPSLTRSHALLLRHHGVGRGPAAPRGGDRGRGTVTSTSI